VTYDELERVLAEAEKIVRVKGEAAPRREERGVPIDKVKFTGLARDLQVDPAV
jgi:hypothetical protein